MLCYYYLYFIFWNFNFVLFSYFLYQRNVQIFSMLADVSQFWIIYLSVPSDKIVYQIVKKITFVIGTNRSPHFVGVVVLLSPSWSVMSLTVDTQTLILLIFIDRLTCAYLSPFSREEQSLTSLPLWVNCNQWRIQ